MFFKQFLMGDKIPREFLLSYHRNSQDVSFYSQSSGEPLKDFEQRDSPVASREQTAGKEAGRPGRSCGCDTG